MAAQTLLDIGAGPGTVMWAAASRFPSLKAVDLVEREADMIRFGRRLAGYAENSLVKQAKWIQGDIRDQELKPHDLVTAAYVLGELDSGARADFVSKLWEAANGTLVIIEPGTTQGFARIRRPGAADRFRSSDSGPVPIKKNADHGQQLVSLFAAGGAQQSAPPD